MYLRARQGSVEGTSRVRLRACQGGAVEDIEGCTRRRV